MSVEGEALSLLAARASRYAGLSLWLAFVTPSPRAASTELSPMLTSFGGADPIVIDGERGVLDTVARIETCQGTGVLVGLDGWNAEDWHALDVLRSRLTKTVQPRILLLESRTLGLMEEFAAHFSSFVERVDIVEREAAEDLSVVDARLASYRVAYGLSDEEAIAKAEHHAHPPDPDFAAWIALLGRGELLVRS